MDQTESKTASQVQTLISQGVVLRQQGDLLGAIANYRQASDLPNAPAEAHFNLGNALFATGDWAGARACMAKALALEPGMVSALMLMARCTQRLGEPESAQEAFEAVLKVAPDHFSAWLELGHVCRTLGQTSQMLAAYQRAATVAPERWEAVASLLRAQEEAGQWEAAARSYHRAVLLVGQAAAQTASQADGQPSEQGAKAMTTASVRDLHWRVAKFRLERGDAARALEAMRQALMAQRLNAMRKAPDVNEVAEMQMDLGEILMRLDMTQEAHRAFEQASKGSSEAVLVRLADISFRYNLWQEAQEILRRNVALHPQSALAHWNLAHLFAESWQMDEALATLAEAEALAPQPGARSMRASVAGRMGDADTALQIYRELAQEEGPLSRMASSAAMSALYSDKLSAHEVAALHRKLFAPLGKGGRSRESFANTRDAHKRLKVGLVSADFHHQHPVNIFMQPVLARLDRTQIELTVYFTGVSYDDQTQLARSRAAHWVECTTWTDAQLARRIEADGIDILMDLAGHTSLHRMSLFAQRAAPVQATFLGYPASTGVPCMDWIMADPVVAPEDSEHLYSEWVCRLPNTVFCFAPEVDYPYPTYDENHAQRPLTFGSFNNVPKLTQHTVTLWARVLNAVPGSRLLLKAPSFKDEAAVRSFKARFAKQGISEDRLIFRGPVGLADMMVEYADVDIALDPVPYNGGTTTLQAMWMGVPVVVKSGGNFVSRMGASFMTAAGLEDWIAQSDEEYVAIAQRMAANRQALLVLKRGLRERLLARPGWDVDRYVRDFESALRHMWHSLCKGDFTSITHINPQQ